MDILLLYKLNTNSSTGMSEVLNRYILVSTFQSKQNLIATKHGGHIDVKITADL